MMSDEERKEGEQQQIPPEGEVLVEWQDREFVRHCKWCDKAFGPVVWKHHCRACGMVVCAGCSPHKMLLRGATKAERVCSKCHEKIQKSGEVPETVERTEPKIAARFFQLAKTFVTDQVMQAAGKAPTCELIRPGPPSKTGLPLRARVDETSTKLWPRYRKPYAGKIVFSNRRIERAFEPDQLSNSFGLSDEIHARAVWERALACYPVGKNGNKPAYGPVNIVGDSWGRWSLYGLVFATYVKVDGKPVVRDLDKQFVPDNDALFFTLETGPKPPGAVRGCSSHQEAAKYVPSPEATDFYGFNQSIVMKLKCEQPNMKDSWEAGAPKLAAVLAKLPAGEHKVDVSLCWRILSRKSDVERWISMGWLAPSKAFCQNTIMSWPIAEGSFTVTVSEDEAGSGGLNTLPKRRCKYSDAQATKIEEELLELIAKSPDWGKRAQKTEVPFHVALTSEWRPAFREHDRDCLQLGNCTCPMMFEIDFELGVYRSPLNGWDRELPARFFRLSALSLTKDASSAGIAVGGNYDVDLDVLPDSVWDKIKRCPEELRNGLQ
eukprot:TRINITY_DN20761_c0_g2_i1.p1 TRINITY_DN20761_c0_g2~~TRINITY_DN20761_c0_g2_i1.p1  ORF type:complete len:548 (-),score=249.99 TRINITY_DN20761_c0_g2_i1:1396-3039(-)